MMLSFLKRKRDERSEAEQDLRRVLFESAVAAIEGDLVEVETRIERAALLLQHLRAMQR